MVIIFIAGVAAEAATQSNIKLAANNRFYAGFPGCLIELDDAVHGAMVGYRQAVHAQVSGP